MHSGRNKNFLSNNESQIIQNQVHNTSQTNYIGLMVGKGAKLSMGNYTGDHTHRMLNINKSQNTTISVITWLTIK